MAASFDHALHRRIAAEQGRPRGPGQYEGRPSRDLRRADSRGGRGSDRCIRQQVQRQARQGGRLSDQGPEALLAFFDFPAEHWGHLRTSNPIESVFATVCHRTVRTKGALSAKTAKLMVFKLVNAAAKTWRRLKGENQLPKVVQGVKFQNGIEVIKMSAHHAA
jgi:putative transposase